MPASIDSGLSWGSVLIDSMASQVPLMPECKGWLGDDFALRRRDADVGSRPDCFHYPDLIARDGWAGRASIAGKAPGHRPKRSHLRSIGSSRRGS